MGDLSAAVNLFFHTLSTVEYGLVTYNSLVMESLNLMILRFNFTVSKILKNLVSVS